MKPNLWQKSISSVTLIYGKQFSKFTAPSRWSIDDLITSKTTGWDIYIKYTYGIYIYVCYIYLRNQKILESITRQNNIAEKGRPFLSELKMVSCSFFLTQESWTQLRISYGLRRKIPLGTKKKRKALESHAC